MMKLKELGKSLGEAKESLNSLKENENNDNNSNSNETGAVNYK